jgi:hypothetical protein
MEACVRYEPQYPRNGGSELLDGAGAFSAEIAREVNRSPSKYLPSSLYLATLD